VGLTSSSWVKKLRSEVEAYKHRFNLEHQFDDWRADFMKRPAAKTISWGGAGAPAAGWLEGERGAGWWPFALVRAPLCAGRGSPRTKQCRTDLRGRSRIVMS